MTSGDGITQGQLDHFLDSLWYAGFGHDTGFAWFRRRDQRYRHPRGTLIYPIELQALREADAWAVVERYAWVERTKTKLEAALLAISEGRSYEWSDE